MSETEQALFWAIQVAFRAILRLGANREIVERELQMMREQQLEFGSRRAAATIAILLRCLDWPETDE
jgi:hypothetical protein